MDQEKIAKFIKSIREKNHQTQKEFADNYNVTFQAVSKWENAKNIPDISLLKQICEDNNVSLDEILGNNVKKKNKKIFLIIIIIILLIILISFLIIHLRSDNNFEFKKLSTTCSSFNLTGSVAYNKDKASLYISNIEFCGEDEDVEYEKIEYSLYESYNDTETKISTSSSEQSTTLADYLKDLSITVDNYSQVCKTFTNSDLYIEIKAYDENDKITLYRIPLSFEENCE